MHFRFSKMPTPQSGILPDKLLVAHLLKELPDVNIRQPVAVLIKVHSE
jgi:hypothetical protein